MSQILVSHPGKTVAIVSDHPEHGGYVVIDADNFDPAVHVEFTGDTAPPVVGAHASPAPTPPASPAAPDGTGTAAGGAPATDVADGTDGASVVTDEPVKAKK